MEHWKDIKGFEGYYQVSDEGRVRRLQGKGCKRDRILKGKVTNHGYLQVNLSIEGVKRWLLVHRLVYEAFKGEIPSGMQVNHIDEDKTNNRLDNLNLMTCKENLNWGTRTERAAEKQINRSDMSKAVCGYDKNGNLVVSFPSTMEAQRNGNHNGKKCRRDRSIYQAA